MNPTSIFVQPPAGLPPARLPEEGAVVVRVPNWLGDAVLALPAVSALAERYRRRSVVILARSHIAPLFTGQSGVADVIRVGGRGAARLVAARGALAGRRVALGVVFPHSLGAAAEVAVARAATLWGYGGPLRRLALDVALPRRWIHGRHRWEEYALLAAAITGQPVAERYPVPRGPGDVAAADALWATAGLAAGEPVIGLVVGSNAGSRRWPPERYAAVASRLGRRGARMAILGGERERPLAEAIAAAADPAPLIWVGGSLPVLAECFRRLAFLVTNDTGPMHLAAAVGTPLVGLIGASDERLTGPRGAASDGLVHPIHCRPCRDNDCAYNLGCLRGISVDGVVGRVEARLA